MGSGSLPQWPTRSVGAAERAHRALARAVREPAVPILLAALLTQVWRRAWLDVAVFGVSAGLIAWDRPRWPGRLPVRQPISDGGRRRGLAVFLAGLVYGAALAPLPRSSGWFSAGLALPGLLAAWAVLRRTPDRPRHGSSDAGTGRDDEAHAEASARGWGAWVVLALVLAVVELAAFLSQSDPRVDNPARPTISTLVDPWLQSPDVRTVAIALWVWLGWWIVVRVRSAAQGGPARPDVRRGGT